MECLFPIIFINSSVNIFLKISQSLLKKICHLPRYFIYLLVFQLLYIVRDKYSQSVLYPSPYQSQARIPKWLRQLTLQLKVLVSLSTLILGVKTLYITFEETFYTYFRWQILFDGGKVWYSQFPKQTCILLCVLYHCKRYQWTKLSKISTHPRATQQDCVKCRRHFTVSAVPTQEAILEEGGT